MRPRNEQCPSRKQGLWHRTDGEYLCAHCGVLLIREDPIAVLRARMVVSGEPQIPEPPPEPRFDIFTVLTEVQWHRLVYERHRFEQGEIGEWPDGVPPESQSSPDPGPITVHLP